MKSIPIQRLTLDEKKLLQSMLRQREEDLERLPWKASGDELAAIDRHVAKESEILESLCDKLEVALAVD